MRSVAAAVVPAGTQRWRWWWWCCWGAVAAASLLARGSPSAACNTDCSCTRGGIVACNYKRLRGFPAGLPENTTSLDLSNNLLSSNLDASGLSSLRFLQKLWLNKNALRTIPNGTFQTLRHLQMLDLQFNDLARVDVGAFKGLSSLKFLYLHNNRLESLPAGTLDHLQGLREVHLYKNEWNCDCREILYLSKWIGDHGKLVMNRLMANDPRNVTCFKSSRAVMDIVAADNFTADGCSDVRVTSQETTTKTTTSTASRRRGKATATPRRSPPSSGSGCEPRGVVVVVVAVAVVSALIPLRLHLI
uniref:Slit homolog 3 protein-like n=2 Tax=Petromyzon marinus TaxID=7757 RepID=A0AAJ7TBE2_PETMA|nr:slit homolog 3 protein-like [Petromyzon marinus]